MNLINISVLNNLKTIQGFSRTTKYFSRIKGITSFDSKFKDSAWCSRTCGNLSGNTNSQFSKLAHNKRQTLASEILNDMPKLPKQALRT